MHDWLKDFEEDMAFYDKINPKGRKYDPVKAKKRQAIIDAADKIVAEYLKKKDGPTLFE
jgi:hypothetical protein